MPDLNLNIQKISLEQALIDVEVANGRIIDLAYRLRAETTKLAILRRGEADSRARELQASIASVKAELAAIRSQ